MTKSNNKAHDFKYATQNIHNEMNRKHLYDNSKNSMKMNNPYIFIDKEINILKKDINDNYDSELKDKEETNNKENSMSKKRSDMTDERERYVHFLEKVIKIKGIIRRSRLLLRKRI